MIHKLLFPNKHYRPGVTPPTNKRSPHFGFESRVVMSRGPGGRVKTKGLFISDEVEGGGMLVISPMGSRGARSSCAIGIPHDAETMRRLIAFFQERLTSLEMGELAEGTLEEQETGICRKRDPETGQELRKESG